MEPTNNFIPQNNPQNNSQVPPANPVSPGFIPKADPAPAAPTPQPAPAPEPVAVPVPTSFIPPSPVVSASAEAGPDTLPVSHTGLWMLALISTAAIFGVAGFFASNMLQSTDLPPTGPEIAVENNAVVPTPVSTSTDNTSTSTFPAHPQRTSCSDYNCLIAAADVCAPTEGVITQASTSTIRKFELNPTGDGRCGLIQGTNVNNFLLICNADKATLAEYFKDIMGGKNLNTQITTSVDGRTEHTHTLTSGKKLACYSGGAL